jgi:putative DNA methylase
VITDPPFFDNVHYAELADFFYVWQQLYFDGQSLLAKPTTRHPDEVQDTDVNAFAQKLANVFTECYRVLRDDGIMVFSYHHSRNDGWLSVANAVLSSNFSFVQAQPVKAEMSVATPKSQATNPIDLDVFLICKKKEDDDRSYLNNTRAFEQACTIASAKIERFNRLGRKLSVTDVKIVLYSQLLEKTS